jgi:hypothetical protein
MVETGADKASGGRVTRPRSRWVVVTFLGVTALAVTVALPVRAFGPAPVEAVGTDGPVGSVPFVARAVGVSRGDLELRDRPGRGTVLAQVAGPATVDVAGVIRVRAGLWWRPVYWVAAEVGGMARHGFVDAKAVDLTAGQAPDLAVADADVAAMLNPAAALGPGAPPTGSALAVPASDPTATINPSTPDGALTIPWLPESVRRWEPDLVAAGARHGVDPDLLAIITLVESGGGPGAVSPSGARGLMQVMPATALDIASQRAIGGFTVDQLGAPTTAVDFGAWYLSQMLRLFGRADDPDWTESVALAAAAYNGGPGSVQRYLAGGALAAEAERYRHWVGTMWRERHDNDSAGFRSWWDAGGRRLVEAAGG